MFIKNILLDSFKELKPVLKNWKLMIITLITLFIQLIFAKIQLYSVIFTLPAVIIGLFSLVYQYIAIATSINTEKKNLYDFFVIEKFSYGTSFINFFRAFFKLFLIFIALIIVSIIVYFIILLTLNVNFFKNNRIISTVTLFIFLFVPIVRYYFFIPLAILGNVNKPLNSSWQLTKGKFWKITLVILCSMIFSLHNSLINLIVKDSNYLSFAIFILLSLISTYINILISINSIYYFMRQDSANDEKTSNIEAI